LGERFLHAQELDDGAAAPETASGLSARAEVEKLAAATAVRRAVAATTGEERRLAAEAMADMLI